MSDALQDWLLEHQEREERLSPRARAMYVPLWIYFALYGTAELCTCCRHGKREPGKMEFNGLEVLPDANDTRLPP